jgi:adenine phosphoribosyltransferase
VTGVQTCALPILRKFPDFPEKDVLFYDIFSILYDPKLRSLAFNCLLYIIRRDFDGKFDLLAGLDSRGLALGLHLAEILEVPFVAVRKAGKLPGQCVSASFKKEYGKDKLEVQKHCIPKGTRVLLIDDLMATGGTFSACDTLVNACEGQVVGYLSLFEISSLHGEKMLKHPELIRTVIQVIN